MKNEKCELNEEGIVYDGIRLKMKIKNEEKVRKWEMIEMKVWQMFKQQRNKHYIKRGMMKKSGRIKWKKEIEKKNEKVSLYIQCDKKGKND